MKKLNLQGLFKILMMSIFMLCVSVQVNYAEISGESLMQKVTDAISDHYTGTDNFTIKTQKNGNVIINGQVNSLYDKYKIFEIVSHVSGVKKISDQVDVNTEMLPNDIIKQNIRYSLDRNTAIKDPSRIKVEVDNGVVMLSGKVSFYREKLIAQSLASWQKGVVGLVNNIYVLPHKQALSDSNLKTVLRGMKHDEFPYSKNVTITVKNGVADLTGSVDDLWTKKHLAMECSSVLGIKKVINNLKIVPQY